MEDIMNLIEQNIGINPSAQTQILKTIIIIIVMAAFYKFIKRILYKVIENTKTYYRFKKILSYILIIFSAILIGRVWFVGVRSITTFVGLFSAGLAIAMKDLVLNVAGWIFILSRKQFRVGDRIEIEGVSGDVIDIKIFDFTIMETGKWIKADQSTGRIVSIPNRDIFNAKLEPTVYTSTNEDGIVLTIRYLCYYRGKRDVKQKIWEAILTSFENHNDIEFSYPTQRVYDRPTENEKNLD